MDTFLVRCDRSTHEIQSILIMNNVVDIFRLPVADPLNDYIVLTNAQFHHLQGSPGYENECSDPQADCNLLPHRYLGGQLVPHMKLAPIADRFIFNVIVGNNPPSPQQQVNITWTAPEPVRVTINGADAGTHNNAIQITASVPGTYRVQIIDPKYVSDIIELKAETPQP